MIIPDKYTNFKYSLLNVGAVILESLKKCPIQKYDDVEDNVVSKLGIKSKPVILYSLGFLYIMGKITYSKKTDIIKLN